MAKTLIYRIFSNQNLWTFAASIITAIGAIYPLYYSSNAQLTGDLVVRPLLATSVFPSADLSPELSKHLKLEFMDKKLNPSHVQLLVYTIQNLSPRIITPKDFYKPIKITALGGRQLINVTANTEENRPPITPVVKNKYEAEIPPTLLNPKDSFSVTVLLDAGHKIPIISNPYSNSESSVQWTALIKGETLINYDPKKPSKFLSDLDLYVYIYHIGYAVVALFILGIVLSFAQVYRFFISDYIYQKFIFSSIEITVRVALAWSAAESIISLFDMPTEAPIGYLFMAAYVAIILLPSLVSIKQFIVKQLSNSTP
ncbi:hypothetical protein [Acidithiobacillus sp.]|nr:hypothetical protein [Acidithiobacillus sp.]MCK9189316.1 hypothetical protein [Acidithiobacillus sp.]MCK9359092.1 hypothetical protein [Acidithiobacillus sp.]